MASLLAYLRPSDNTGSDATGVSIGERANPENPATSLSQPDQWLTNLFAGPTTSGVSVTADTSLGISAVWRAVKILGENIASLSGDVFQENDSGDRQKLMSHPVARIMREPSPLCTGFTFRETMQADAALTGNAIAVIRRLKDQTVVELRHVRPNQMTTRYSPLTGQLVYTYTDLKGETFSTDSSNILHIPALVMDSEKCMGKSPIQVHRENLGLSIAQTQYGAKFFKNGAHIDGFLTTDQNLTADAAKRMAKSWKQRYAGIENAGSTPVLEEGLKYVPLSLSPGDAMFIESSQMSVQVVARIFGVPLHMLASLDRATFSNIEHQSREFVTYTLRPWVKRWEAEINRKLFTEREKAAGIYWRFNLDSLLRGVPETRAKLYDSYMKWGILTRDEVRRLEGFNGSSDDMGDKHLVPVNMVPAELAGQFASNKTNNSGNSDQNQQ